jgi:hypothetical protein
MACFFPKIFSTRYFLCTSENPQRQLNCPASESAVSFVLLWATGSFSGLNRSHLGSTCLSNAGRARKKTTETERMEESLQQAFGLINRLTHEQGRSRHPEG